MLSTARMSKLKAIVLDQYSEDVVREFSKLGTVQIVDIKESMEDWKGADLALPDEKKLNKASELQGRIYYILDVLGIKEERDFFGSLKGEPKKLSWKNEGTEKQLSEVEKQFYVIEKSVIKKSDSLVDLGEEKARLEPEKAVLEALVRLNAQSKWIGESRFLYISAGMVKPEDLDRMRVALEKQRIEFILKEATIGEKIAMLLATPREHRSEVDRVLSGIDFQKFAIDKDKSTDSLKDIRHRLEEIEKEMKHVRKELEEDKEKYKDQLFAYREIVQIEKNITETSNLMAKTRRVYVLEGWVPKKEVSKLVNQVTLVSSGCAVVKEVEPKKGEVPPSKFDNPKIFKPFELLIGTLGLPSYREIDPTPIVALTFPFIYGLMFGDVGHGLILALIGVAFAYLGRKTSSAYNIGIIVIICGIASMFFGFVYGEAFGVSHAKQQETIGFAIPLFFTKEIVVHGEHEVVPLFNPLEDPIEFLKLAILLGSAHIAFGIFMSLLNKLRQKDIFGAIGGPLPRLWLYCGLVYLFMTYWTNFALWGENLSTVILLVPVPMVLILFGDVIMHLPHFNIKKIGGELGQGGFEVFDTGLLFLSNSISYSRIFALAMVHGGLFLALFSIGEQLKALPAVGFLAWLIVIFVGTMAIIALESIVVFLHSLRLHYYEWFTKFYAADGLKFTPFKAERTYTKLEGETD
jgi:V/A-type H+/Na+-transporting ATPase subunit I